MQTCSTFHNFQALHLAVVASFPCNIWGKNTLQPSIFILLSTQSLQEPRDCHGQISGSREFADQESQKNNEICEIMAAQSNASSFKQRKQNLQRVSLPLVKLLDLWFVSVFSHAQHIPSSAGESDCNYQSNKYEFPSQLIFHLSWQWSHPSQNQLHIALETTGYLDVARMHHLSDSLSFSSATLPTPCAVDPFGYCHSGPLCWEVFKWPRCLPSSSLHSAYLETLNR